MKIKNMKMKRITALGVVLVAVVGIAVFYFSHEDTVVDVVMGNYDWNQDENRPQYFDQLNPQSGVWEYSYGGPVIDGAISEEIVQNINLGKNGAHTYTLFLRERFDRHPTNNRYFGYYYQIKEQAQEESEVFYVDRTEVVKNGVRNEIVRTYQNIASGKFHTLPLAYFWILPEGIEPENAIAALITADPNMRVGCYVKEMEYYGEGHGAYNADPSTEPTDGALMQFQIMFDLEKVDTNTLQGLSSQVVKLPCGAYGPQQITSYDTGLFVTQNDVLLYIPYESTLWVDSIVRMVKTLN